MKKRSSDFGRIDVEELEKTKERVLAVKDIAKEANIYTDEVLDICSMFLYDKLWLCRRFNSNGYCSNDCWSGSTCFGHI